MTIREGLVVVAGVCAPSRYSGSKDTNYTIRNSREDLQCMLPTIPEILKDTKYFIFSERKRLAERRTSRE